MYIFGVNTAEINYSNGKLTVHHFNTGTVIKVMIEHRVLHYCHLCFQVLLFLSCFAAVRNAP